METFECIIDEDLPVPSSQNILILIAILKKYDYLIDVFSIISAHKIVDIIIAKKAMGEPCNKRLLKNILSPLFCKNQVQQALFDQILDEWIVKCYSHKKEKTGTGSITNLDSLPNKNRFLFLSLLILCILFAFGSIKFFHFDISRQKTWTTPVRGSLFGKVLGLNGIPVPKATVIADQCTTTTEIDGSFLMLPKENVTAALILHPQYVPKRIQFKPGVEVLVNIKPRKTNPTIRGIVKDKNDGKSVKNATVYLLDDTLVTDTNGCFSKAYTQSDSVVYLVADAKNYLVLKMAICLDGTDSVVVVPMVKGDQPRSMPIESSLDVVARVNKIAEQVKDRIAREHESNIFVRFGTLASEILLFLFFTISLCIYWKNVSQKKAILEKALSEKPPEVKEINVINTAGLLFSSIFFKQIAKEFRQWRDTGLSFIDIKKTVKRTSDQGGCLSLAYRNTTIQPQYLVLIDQKSFNDQHAMYLGDIISALAKNNVFIEQYFYNSDPRVIKLNPKKGAFTTLAGLCKTHHKHRLLIFTDGIGLINPFNSSLNDAGKMLQLWSQRTVFLPDTTNDSKFIEKILIDADFRVEPASLEGLQHLVCSIDENNTSYNWRCNRLFPKTLLNYPIECLSRNEPLASFQHNLFKELKEYLGDEGFVVLASCAIYPELNYELTLYICSSILLTSNTSNISSKIQLIIHDLTILPWFQQKSIPDWLRVRLIKCLSEEENNKVTSALNELLGTAKEKEKGNGYPDKFALSYSEEAFKRNFTDYKNWLKRKHEGNKSTIMQDYILAHYLLNSRKSILHFPLPGFIEKLIFNKGERRLGFNLLSLLTIFGTFTFALLLLIHLFTPPRKETYFPTFIQSNKANSSDTSVSVDSVGRYIHSFIHNRPHRQLIDDNKKSSEYLQWLIDTLTSCVQFDTTKYALIMNRFLYSGKDLSGRYLFLFPKSEDRDKKQDPKLTQQIMPRVVLHSDTTGREDGFAINGTQVGKDTLYASATDTVILNSIKRKQSVLSDTNAGWLEKIDVLDSIISAGTHDSGETIPGLSLSLKSGDVLTRQLAARVIGMQKNIDSEMRNSLVSALSDEKSEVRIEAIKALGSLACKDSVVMNLINQKCNTGTLEERQIAEHTLTYSMRDMPFEWLKDVYEQNKSLRLRAGAIRMIGEKILDKRELRTKLIKTALNDSNLIIKLAGMDAVVNSSFKDSLLINDAAIISVLKKFILGDNIELGEKAAETIMNAHILGTGVTDVLVDGLNSTKFSIAAKCAEALGQEIRIDDHSTEALIKHLQSNNADVVTATANSLINRKNYNRFYGEILATLNSSSITTQENGLKILANDAEIKLEQNTIDKVVMLLKDKNTSLKASALNVIIKHNIMNVEISKLLFSIIDNPQVERVPFSKATEILNKNENINRLDRKTILYYLKNGKQTDTKTTCIEILDRRQEFDAEIVDILSDALKEALKKAQNDIFSVSTAFSSDPVGQSAKEILKKISQKSNLDPSLKKKIENILQVAP